MPSQRLFNRSLAYFPWGEQRRYRGDSIHSNFYASMFYEDLQLSLFPFRNGRNRIWNLIGDSKEEIRRSVRVFRTQDNNPYLEPEEIMENFVKEVIQLLCLEDIAYYEICSISEDSENWEVLGIVPPVGLKIGKKVVQTIPPDEIHNIPLSTRELDREHFFIFKTPEWIFSGGGFSGVFRFLVEETSRSLNGSRFLDAESNGNKTGFDFKKNHDLNMSAVLWVTNEFGWSVRGEGTKYMTDYYFHFRLLRFKIFQRRLVEFLILEMNRVLRMPVIGNGRLLPIKIEGLLSSSDYMNKLVEFENGTIRFSDVRDLVYKT